MFYKDFGVQVSSAPDLYITLFSNIDPRLIICCRVIYFFCVNSNLIIIITLYRYLSFKEWRRYSEPSLVFRSQVSHFSHVNYVFYHRDGEISGLGSTAPGLLSSPPLLENYWRAEPGQQAFPKLESWSPILLRTQQKFNFTLGSPYTARRSNCHTACIIQGKVSVWHNPILLVECRTCRFSSGQYLQHGELMTAVSNTLVTYSFML